MLPLTETFGDFAPEFRGYDQAVVICEKCGHIQLGFSLNPKLLYTEIDYKYRTTGLKRDAESEFFLDKIFAHLTILKPKVLEFGANDLSLANMMSNKAELIVAVDPVIPESQQAEKNITAVREFVESYLQRVDTKFDLIISRHTLEHVSNPTNLLNMLWDRLSEKGLIVMEFPDLQAIMSSLRGDAFFHQHYNYFDRQSVLQMALRSNLKVEAVYRNERGSNGGSMIVVLSKRGSDQAERVESQRTSIQSRISDFQKFVSLFRIQMDLTKGLLEKSNDCSGFGAGLMLPTLSYHLGGLSNYIELIYDDDESKSGWHYKNVDVQVQKAPEHLKGQTVLITSLENTRAISRRLIDLGAGRIISPIVF